VMTRPPRKRQERLLSWPLLARAYLFLGPLQAAIAMSVYFFVLDSLGWRFGDRLAPLDPVYLQATAGTLTGIVLAQMANVFVCRHPQLPAWHFPLLDNRLLLAGLLLEAGLLLWIVYTPLGNRLFGTAPLGGDVWLLAAALAVGFAAIEETRKFVVRRWPS